VTTSLVIQTSFLGDVVLTTPLLSQLAKRGPVDVVTTPAGAALLANHAAVRTLIPYDKRGAASGIGGFFSLAKQLRANSYDIAFLAQGSWRSAALAWVAGIPARTGFATSAGRLFYTRRVDYRDDLHHTARLLLLSRPNGREPSHGELQPSLYPKVTEDAAVDALLAANDVHEHEPLIVLAPGSVWATKRWPFYPDLARALSGEGRIVIAGGAEDDALAAEIVAVVPNAVNAAGKLSLLASAELIGRAAVVVTNDSAPQHLASAMGTPTVSIFGPTVPDFGFGPLAPRSIVLGKADLACRPCDRHGPQKCPLGHHNCMRTLGVEQVVAATRSLL
jgi:heptosyltransferase II